MIVCLMDKVLQILDPDFRSKYVDDLSVLELVMMARIQKTCEVRIL